MSAARAVRMSRTRRARSLGASVVLLVAALFGALAGAAPAAGAAERAAAAGSDGAVRGGDPVYGEGGTRCTIGFNARNAQGFYGIVAGHCARGGRLWYADPQLRTPVGETETVHFPGTDWALIRYTNPDLEYPSEVTRYGGSPLRIERAAQPAVGSTVCTSGATTGWHCGVVQAVNATIMYPEGAVSGLIRASICAEPGDTAGPAVSGSAGVGLRVGGSGSCSTGGTTYYQPLAPVLSAFGLQVGY